MTIGIRAIPGPNVINATEEVILQNHERRLRSMELRMDRMQEMMAKNLEQTTTQFKAMGGQIDQINQKLQTAEEELSQRIKEALEAFHRSEKETFTVAGTQVPTSTILIEPVQPQSSVTNSILPLQFVTSTTIFPATNTSIPTTNQGHKSGNIMQNPSSMIHMYCNQLPSIVSIPEPNVKHFATNPNSTPRPYMASQIHTPVNTPYTQPQFEQTKPALPALAHLIHSNSNDEVLTDACWALSYSSDGTIDKIHDVIDVGVCPRLVELLLHPSPSVLIHPKVNFIPIALHMVEMEKGENLDEIVLFKFLRFVFDPGGIMIFGNWTEINLEDKVLLRNGECNKSIATCQKY